MPREPGGHPGADHRRLATPLRLAGVGVCVLVLVVAVAGLAGGLERVPDRQLPVLAVDEVSDGQPWNVAVTAAHLFRKLGDFEPLEDDSHFLVVVANIEVTARESRSDISFVMYPWGVEGLTSEFALTGLEDGKAFGADEVALVRDSTAVADLHPGLPERVVFLWEQSDDVVPTEVTLRIVSMTLRESTLSGHMEWLDPEPRAQVTVPVRDRRDES
ncbi:MAG: hypothetical protein ACRDT2_07005 [Natronosporangium sp.]